MPLFQCTNCGAVENTACCNYWPRRYLQKLPPICSECETGAWHGRFEKKSAHERGYLLGANGYIYHPDEGAVQTKLLGPVPKVPG